MRTPDYLRSTHELLVGAWRFAENAHPRPLRRDRRRQCRGRVGSVLSRRRRADDARRASSWKSARSWNRPGCSKPRIKAQCCDVEHWALIEMTHTSRDTPGARARPPGVSRSRHRRSRARARRSTPATGWSSSRPAPRPRTCCDGIEARAIAASGAVILPDLVTPRELTERLAERLDARPVLTGAEREALLGSACRATREAGSRATVRDQARPDFRDPALLRRAAAAQEQRGRLRAPRALTPRAGRVDRPRRRTARHPDSVPGHRVSRVRAPNRRARVGRARPPANGSRRRRRHARTGTSC